MTECSNYSLSYKGCRTNGAVLSFRKARSRASRSNCLINHFSVVELCNSGLCYDNCGTHRAMLTFSLALRCASCRNSRIYNFGVVKFVNLEIFCKAARIAGSCLHSGCRAGRRCSSDPRRERMNVLTRCGFTFVGILCCLIVATFGGFINDTAGGFIRGLITVDIVGYFITDSSIIGGGVIIAACTSHTHYQYQKAQ